jgi:hypothetical protein
MINSLLVKNGDNITDKEAPPLLLCSNIYIYKSWLAKHLEKVIHGFFPFSKFSFAYPLFSFVMSIMLQSLWHLSGRTESLLHRLRSDPPTSSSTTPSTNAMGMAQTSLAPCSISPALVSQLQSGGPKHVIEQAIVLPPTESIRSCVVHSKTQYDLLPSDNANQVGGKKKRTYTILTPMLYHKNISPHKHICNNTRDLLSGTPLCLLKYFILVRHVCGKRLCMHAFVCMYIYTYVHSHFDEMYMQ